MIYGDQLSFFTEQFRYVSYFKMPPNVVASFSRRTELGKVKGVFQYVNKSDYIKEADTLNAIGHTTFWTREKLDMGNFIEFEEQVYRLKGSYGWGMESGFYVYELAVVTGVIDTQEPMRDVNLGVRDYD